MPLTEGATKTSCYDFCSPRKQRNIAFNMKSTVHSFSVPLKKYYSADLLARFSRAGWPQGRLGVEGWGWGSWDGAGGGGVGELNGLLLLFPSSLRAAANLSIFSSDNTLKYIIVIPSCLIHYL